MKQKIFDPYSLYITESECRVKHQLGTDFLRGLFAYNGMDAAETLHRVYERVGLTSTADDCLIYIGLEEKAARDAIQDMQENAPCYVVRREGSTYAPESYCYVFFSVGNRDKINALLIKHGFYKLDISGYFRTDGATLAENEKKPENNMLPPQAEIAPPLSQNKVNPEECALDVTAAGLEERETVQNAFSSGILALPNNIYTLPPIVAAQLKDNGYNHVRVCMSADGWKKYGYQVTEESAGLFIKDVPNSNAALPVYGQNSVAKTECDTPLDTSMREEALRRSVIVLQEILRQNARTRDANIQRSPLPQYAETELRGKSAVELTGCLLAMLPALVYIQSAAADLPDAHKALAENGAKRVVLSSLSSDIGGAAFQLEADMPEEKTMVSEIAKTGARIPALLGCISGAAQTLYATVNQNLERERDGVRAIDEAKDILRKVTPEQLRKAPLIHPNGYKRENGEIKLSVAEAKNIIQAMAKLRVDLSLGQSIGDTR